MTSEACGLPKEFLDRAAQIIAPSLWPEFLRSFDLQRRTALRVNTLRMGVDEMADRLQKQGLKFSRVSWSSDALAIDPNDRAVFSHLAETTRGELYLQSLSSQLAALLVAPKPGDQVLDLAAAPGGKASHLAALMQNQGLLSCVEPIRKRFFSLQANLKNLGVAIARYYMTDGRIVGKKVGPRFDRVLLDAPCSGEARFTSVDPDSYATWSLRKTRETSRKQVGLIESAFTALRPGGVLLYSTCSYSPQENESVVAQLLERQPQASVIPIPELNDLATPGYFDWPVDRIPVMPGLTKFADREFPSSIAETRRILPNRWFDGFFLALLRRQ